MNIASGRDAVLNGMLVGQADGNVGAGGDIVGGGTQAYVGAANYTAGHDVALTGGVQASRIAVGAANDAALRDVSSASTPTVVANGTAGGGDVSIGGNAAAASGATLTASRDIAVSGALGTGGDLRLHAGRSIGATSDTGTIALTGTTQSAGALTLDAGLDAALGGTVAVGRALRVGAGRDVLLGGGLAGQQGGAIHASRDVQGAGTAAFGNAVALNADRDIALTGTLQGGTVVVTGGHDVGLGTVQATTGDLSVLAGAAQAGIGVSRLAAAASTGGDLTIAGNATAFGDLTLQAGRDIAVGGTSTSGGAATIDATRNATLRDVKATGDLTVSARDGGIASATLTGNGAVRADAGTDLATGAIQSTCAVTLRARGANGAGDVVVEGGIASGAAAPTSLTAARDLSVAGAVTSGGALDATAGRNLRMGGSIDGDAAVTLTATGGTLTVVGKTTSVASFQASAGTDLTLAGALVNGDTTLRSGGAMILGGAMLGLGAGTFTAAGSLNTQALTYGQDLSLTARTSLAVGTIQGAGAVTALSRNDLTVAASTSVGNLSLTSTAGNVGVNGAVLSGGDVRLLAATNVTAAGTVAAMGDTTLTATNGNVTAAGLSANGDATLSAGNTVTLNGTSTVVGNVALSGANVTLAGSLSGSKNIVATARNTLDASRASLVSSKDMAFTGANVTLGAVVVGGNLNAQASNRLALSGGAVNVVGAATLVSQNILDNASAVLAGGALTISAATLSNAVNASFASVGTTSITANTFTNAGRVNGAATWITVGGALDNTGGSLMGVDSLSINAGSLNNQGGLVFAGNVAGGSAGDLSLTLNGGNGALNNASGQLLAQRNLGLTATNMTLDPSLGAISAGGNVYVTAAAINITGTWNFSGQSVSLTGLQGITNYGTLSGSAPLTIGTGGTFTNFGQVSGNNITFYGVLYNANVVHADNNLTIQGETINRGTIETGGNIAISGGNYDNYGALTQTRGDMNVTLAGVLQNTGGSLIAGNNININAGAVINDQTAPSGQQVVTTQIRDSALLGAIGIGYRISSQAYGSDTGDYVSQSASSATFADLLAPSGSGAKGSYDTGSTVTFVLRSIVTGYDDYGNAQYDTQWTVASGPQADALQNITLALPAITLSTTTQSAGTSGVISAGNSISVTANALSNQGGQISANNNVTLVLQSLSNGPVAPNVTNQTTEAVDQGQLSTFLNTVRGLRGGVVVDGTGTATTPADYFSVNNGVAAPVVQSSVAWSSPYGTILAGTDLAVYGGNLVNAGLLYAGRNVTIASASFTNQGGNQQNYSSQVGCAAGVPNSACGTAGGTRGNNATTTGFSYGQSNATVYAGNNLVIAAGQINNTYGNLLAGHDIVIGGVGTTASSTTAASTLNNTSGNIVAGHDITLNVAGAITNTLPPPVAVHENYGSQTKYAGCMTAGGYKESYCEAYVDQQSGNSSVISAGNALAITAGSLTNIGSLISAGTSATINVAGPVVNEAQTLNAYWHSHWVQETGMFSSDKRNDTWACGSVAECQALYGSAYTGGTIDPPQPVGNIAATIQAPSLSISSGGQIENVGNVIGTSVSLTGQKLINGITTANTYTPRVNGASQVISLSPVSLASLNLSIPRTLGSGAIPVAVAGTASYVDSSLGSGAAYTPQYLISNLPASLQPSSTLFYYSPQEEDLLLQQAALQQTGKASLVDGLSYDSKTGLSVTEQEKAYLYQNALSYAQASNLQLGVALTQTQISALDKPMLWYVEQTVPDPSCAASGTASCPTITALMPQIYLPQGTSTMTAGGNITGTDVTLNFAQSVVNTGSVTASNTLSVTTGSLVNQANQVNVGQVWSSVAGGYVETTGTTVQPGGFMSAANMDLNVQTLTQVGGALQALNTDGTVNAANSAALVAQIQSQLAGSFTQTAVGDDLNTSFVKAGGSFSLTDLAAMAVAVAASIATYGAASSAIGILATSAGSTLSAATAATAGVAATSAGLGNIVLSAAVAGMVSSAASQIVSTGGIDLKQVGSAGLIAGLTAGLLNGITYSGVDGISFNTGVSSLNAPTLANLAGIQNLAYSGVSQAGTSVAGTVAGTAAAITATSAISAAVQTAVGGGSWLDNFEHAAVSGAAAAGAFEIGELQGTDQLGSGASGELAYLAAHAALGCASSAALEGVMNLSGSSVS